MVSISILIIFSSAEELLDNTDMPNDRNLQSYNLVVQSIYSVYAIYLINIMQMIHCNT